MPTKRPTRRRPDPAPTVSAGFAGQLREIIAGRDLTAYSVARSAGVAPSVVSRFMSRERGLTLETFDAIAGALNLRLVEAGRGRGRPSRTAGPDARSGPGALHCLTRNDEDPSPGDGPDDTASAAAGLDATPGDASPEAAPAIDEGAAGTASGGAGARVVDVKRPTGDAAGPPADPIPAPSGTDRAAPRVDPRGSASIGESNWTQTVHQVVHQGRVAT